MRWHLSSPPPPPDRCKNLASFHLTLYIYNSFATPDTCYIYWWGHKLLKAWVPLKWKELCDRAQLPCSTHFSLECHAPVPKDHFEMTLSCYIDEFSLGLTLHNFFFQMAIVVTSETCWWQGLTPPSVKTYLLLKPADGRNLPLMMMTTPLIQKSSPAGVHHPPTHPPEGFRSAAFPSHRMIILILKLKKSKWSFWAEQKKSPWY